MNAGKSISLIFASGAEKNIFSRYQIKAHIFKYKFSVGCSSVVKSLIETFTVVDLAENAALWRVRPIVSALRIVPITRN